MYELINADATHALAPSRWSNCTALFRQNLSVVFGDANEGSRYVKENSGIIHMNIDSR
jgi:hypothetical protein